MALVGGIPMELLFLLLPVIVYFSYRNETPLPRVFAWFAAACLLPVILDAHKYLSMPWVTISMYVFFVPGLLLMAYLGGSRAYAPHNQ